MNRDEWNAAVRREYDKSPALSLFTRRPLPLEFAQRFGLLSAARAARRVTTARQGGGKEQPADHIQPALFDHLCPRCGTTPAEIDQEAA